MLRTDGRTDARTDGRTDGQRENSIPTTNKVCGGYRYMSPPTSGFQLNSSPLCHLQQAEIYLCTKIRVLRKPDLKKYVSIIF